MLDCSGSPNDILLIFASWGAAQISATKSNPAPCGSNAPTVRGVLPRRFYLDGRLLRKTPAPAADESATRGVSPPHESPGWISNLEKQGMVTNEEEVQNLRVVETESAVYEISVVTTINVDLSELTENEKENQG